MKTPYVIILCSLTGLTNHANSQNLLWAKEMGGFVGMDIAVDAAGNVYTTGTFSDTADFDPGPGTYYLYGGNTLDIFISKLDASGNFVWAKQFGGTNASYSNSIAVDLNGNVYTTGIFNSTVDFDPGPAIYNLTLIGIWENTFVSKLDAAGNFVWVKQFGGTNIIEGLKIAADAAGNVYTTGHFRGKIDFDPGPATDTLTTSGDFDIFILKLDTYGNFTWAKQMGGTGAEQNRALALDTSANIYTSGNFYGTGDFDPGPGIYNLTSSGSADIFISKIDSSGNFVWSKSMGGTLSDECYAITADAGGRVYTSGRFRGTADFNPGPGTYNLTSVSNNYDIFISKLTASGNFAWAKQIGGASSIDVGFSIAVDAGGNVYTTGQFEDFVDFDPGPGTYYMTSAGALDVFLSRLDAAGNFLWTGQMGGVQDDGGASLRTDISANIYITGIFQDTADFDPGPGIFNLVAPGGGNIFVVKLGSVTGIMESSSSNHAVTIYPNPCNRQTTVRGSDIIDEIKITNLQGQYIYQSNPGQKDISLQIDQPGIYFIQITGDSKTITKKLIVCR